MAEDPAASPAPPRPGAGAARYRAALRCAILRRERGVGRHVLERWGWLFPRVVVGNLLAVVGFLVHLAGADAPPPAPEICADPAPERLPASLLHHEAAEEGVVVVVSKSMILVGDDPTPVLQLPPRDVLVREGVGARYKRGGPGDLFLVPLAEALDRQYAALHRKGDDAPMEAVVIADATTPYRLLVEVLFTLGQSHVGKYHLMVRAKAQP